MRYLEAPAVGGTHTGLAAGFLVGGWWNPYFWAASAAHTAAAVSWFSTGSYLDSGLDFDHAVLVGAYRVDVIATNHRFLWKRWTTYKYITVPETHDGVVPVKSQQLDKSKGNIVLWAETPIKGVNHMEQFNHPNTRREFDAAFTSDKYKDHFRTDRY